MVKKVLRYPSERFLNVKKVCRHPSGGFLNAKVRQFAHSGIFRCNTRLFICNMEGKKSMFLEKTGGGRISLDASLPTIKKNY